MGKRKKHRSHENVKKKLRKIEKYLNLKSDSSESNDEEEYCLGYNNDSRSPSPRRRSSTSSELPQYEYDEKENIDVPDQYVELSNNNSISITDPTETQPQLSQVSTALPEDILDALGDPKGREEIFGPNIPEEVSKRWGRVLVDGLTKEQKQNLLENTLIPANFQLTKAPALNLEIAAVLSGIIKNRDKLLEKAQNHLGIGIAGLTNLTAAIIEKEMNKIELLKRISDITQIFLDLHYEETKARRKLIMGALDKKFTGMISGVKRDSLLFGENLGDKIKASNTAERSGLQIKRSDNNLSNNRKNTPQGNWKGPPRSSNQQRHYKQGGLKNRHQYSTSKRSQTAADRPAAATTSRVNKTRKT